MLLLQATETGAETPLWTAEDRAWATRLAQQTVPAGADTGRFVAERAAHAMQRLLPRDAAARRFVERRGWRPAWLLAAAAGALLLGAVADHIGARQRVDLLAPPVWALVAWSLVVYLGLLVPQAGRRLQRALARRLAGGPGGVQALWARQAMPLAQARAALVLHVAAALLATGVAGGMYLRGLVLDYRAGWQSTFLDAPAVQALLDTGLAPAARVTGIAVPAVAPLRIGPEAPPAGPAAPWIHLYAATLALFIAVPRLVLAAWAAARAWRLARRFPLQLAEPYFERLHLAQRGAAAGVQVLPHGAAPGPQAALGLRQLLVAHVGDALALRFAEPVAYGDEDRVPAPEAATTLRIALVDLGATPEDEVHGRFVAALRTAGLPVLLLADEASFRRRFAALPERIAERRAAWQRLADAHGAAFVAADLDAPDTAAAGPALQRAFAA